MERRTQQLLQMPAHEAANHVAVLQQREFHVSMEMQQLQRQLHQLARGGRAGPEGHGHAGGGAGREGGGEEGGAEGRSVVGVDPESLSEQDKERGALLQRLAVSRSLRLAG